MKIVYNIHYNKPFNMIINNENEFQNQDYINKWYTNSTKLKKLEQLDIIKKYLIFNSIPENIIKFSSDYIFEFYNLISDQTKKIKLRAENVYKLSILQIINKFKIYFQNILEFEIFFEKKNEREISNENKPSKHGRIHDVQIEISNSNSKKQVLVILEYNEISHEKVLDSYKETKLSFNSDLYIIYHEKNKNINELNLINTIKKFISSIFCICCTLSNNKYILSKIIYFENFEHLDLVQLETKTSIFNFIMEISNSDTFDLKKLYLELNPYNEDGEEYTYKEFVKLLKSDYSISIKYDSKSTNYDSKYFSTIIVYLNSNISDNIIEYKQIYLESIKALDNASNKIIQFNIEQFEKMNNLQKYLREYVEFDLILNIDRSVLKKLYKKLKIKYEEDNFG